MKPRRGFIPLLAQSIHHTEDASNAENQPKEVQDRPGRLQ
jgi:hypothetical protein